MKKPVTFARSFTTVMYCSVAILLAACGGAADETTGQQSLAGITASEIMEGSGVSGAQAPAVGDAVPDSVVQETTAPQPAPQTVDSAAIVAAPDSAPTSADSDIANVAVTGPTARVPGPAANEFSLNGYQDKPPASTADGATQGTTAGADGQHATPLPAA